MKHLIIAIILTTTTISCQVPATIETPTNGTEHTINLAFSSTSQSTNDLIAVQIYTYDSKGVKSPYQYGLFDSYTLPPIVLNDNATYSISTTSITNGKDIIAQKSPESYYKPFITGLTKPTEVTNSFQTSNSELAYISSGTADINYNGSTKTFEQPQLFRYAGYTDIFSPSENLNLNIELKRVYAILRISTQNFTDGTITLDIDGSQSIFLTTDMDQIDIPLSLRGTEPFSQDWSEEGYSEYVLYSAFHTNSKGMTTALAEDQSLEIIRNKIHPINIQFDSHTSSVSLSIENSDMEITSETIIKG